MSGKLKGDMLKPLINQPESYSKATTLSGFFARVPYKILLNIYSCPFITSSIEL